MAFQHSSVGVRMCVCRSRSEGREWKEGVQVPMQVGGRADRAEAGTFNLPPLRVRCPMN